MYYTYLPSKNKTPEKSGRRLDQSSIQSIQKCASIMCATFSKLKEVGRKFQYNDSMLGSCVIVGKLRKLRAAQSQQGKEMVLLQIEDQTGSLNIQVYRNSEPGDLLKAVLKLNEMENESIDKLVGSYLRVVFTSKRPMIKTRPVVHTCIGLQLVTDFNLLTQHRLEVIRDYCKSRYG